MTPPSTSTSLHLENRLCLECGHENDCGQACLGKVLSLGKAIKGQATFLEETQNSHGTQGFPAQAPASFSGLTTTLHCLVHGASITVLCFKLPTNKDVSSFVLLLA